MSPDGPTRLILGNLDAEVELAVIRAQAAETGAGAGPSHPPLSAAANRRASEAATLLRVFAEEGDRLWTPATVAAERLPRGGGLPVPELVTGRPEPAERLLAWAETPRVGRLRAASGAAPPPAGVSSPQPSPALEPSPALPRAVWELPPPSPDVVGRVHHRRFHLETAIALGLALPGAAMVASVAELAALLRGAGSWRGARLGGGGWLVKAPFSAAGRERVSGDGPSALEDPAVRARVESLLASQGELLVEPLAMRRADFGCAALLAPGGVRICGIHRQLVDSRGGFRGIRLLPAERARGRGRGAGDDGEAGDGLAPAERAALVRAVYGVGEALAGEGYSGPFGVDAWRYREPDGREGFHPLGEINARMTFGLVAHALAERIGPRAEPPAPAMHGAELRLGGAAPEGREAAITLLAPGDGSPFGIWWLGPDYS